MLDQVANEVRGDVARERVPDPTVLAIENRDCQIALPDEVLEKDERDQRHSGDVHHEEGRDEAVWQSVRASLPEQRTRDEEQEVGREPAGGRTPSSKHERAEWRGERPEDDRARGRETAQREHQNERKQQA